jgi:voltage-gated potassium channel
MISSLLNAIRTPESPAGRRLWLVVATLILLTLVAAVLDTIPDLPGWAVTALGAFEVFVVACFTIDYVLRIIAADRKAKYVFSFFGLVDLLAILPFYLGLAFDLRTLRGLRLLRLFTVLKLSRYRAAVDRLSEAFRSVRAELTVFGFLALLVLYLCGMCIYYLENPVQPDQFRSALDGFWFALTTLTTVGYGDLYPVTPLGRLFVGVIMVVGLGIVAVPTALIASALTRGTGRSTETAPSTAKDTDIHRPTVS